MSNQIRRSWGLSVLWACSILLLPACSGMLARGRPSVSQGPRADLLRVGVTPDAPPVIYKVGDRIQGVEADFARALAKELGREVLFVELAWIDEIPALEQGRIDIIMAGMSVTQVRRDRVAFSDPYMAGGLMALVRRKDENKFAGPFAFITAEAEVAVQRGSTGDYFVQKYMKSARRESYDTVTEAFEMLKEGRVDMLIHDAPVVWQLAAAEPSSGLVPATTRLTVEYYAWAVSLDSPELLAQVNAVIEKWREDGTLTRTVQHWIPSAR